MNQRIRERYLNYFISDEQLKQYLSYSVITQEDYDELRREKRGIVIPDTPPIIVIPDGTEQGEPIEKPAAPPEPEQSEEPGQDGQAQDEAADQAEPSEPQPEES